MTSYADMKEHLRPQSQWRELLTSEFARDYMIQLQSFLNKEDADGKSILPGGAQVFAALNSTDLPDVRVVIIGQDPYPTFGHAHGLAFSVLPSVRPLPRSLQNIYRELKDDLSVERPNGCLVPWARQGVLLLNSVLTVELGLPGSHANLGWETFTEKIIQLVSQQRRSIAFILWGGYAQKKCVFIDRSRHFVLETAHPSPLSARRGFFGSRPFSRINSFLHEKGMPAIDWANTAIDFT